MANLVTVGRIGLLFVGIAFLYVDQRWVAFTAWLLLTVVFLGDALDGMIARRRGETTIFGSVFDIAGDRVVENALWIVFADLGLIGVWAPLVVVTRGFLVDALRSVALQAGKTPFGEKTMARSRLSRFLTASRFMRGLYGIAKFIAFLFLTGLSIEQQIGMPWLGSLWHQSGVLGTGWVCVYATLILTIIRGMPVVVDAWPYLGWHETEFRRMV